MPSDPLGDDGRVGEPMLSTTKNLQAFTAGLKRPFFRFYHWHQSIIPKRVRPSDGSVEVWRLAGEA